MGWELSLKEQQKLDGVHFYGSGLASIVIPNSVKCKANSTPPHGENEAPCGGAGWAILGSG